MGGEILGGIFVWLVFLVGFFGSVMLLGLSLTSSSRPYALCVLVAAIVFAVLSSLKDGHPEDAVIGSLAIWYSLGVVVFGTSAYAINWLIRWHRKRSAS
jgi:hypothetical protein